MAYKFSEIRDLLLHTSNVASAASTRAQETSNVLFRSGDAPPLQSVLVNSNILPSATLSNVAIGSSNQRFKEAWIDELHLSTNTLYLGSTPILGTDQDTVNISADVDQSILVKTTGLGVSSMSSQKGVTIATSGLNAIVDVLSSGSGGQITMGAEGSVTINTPSTTITSNMTVNGNLTVNGTQFIVNTQTLEVADNIILLNKGQVGSGVSSGTAGITIDRGDALDYQLLFDEADDKFKMGPQGTLSAIATEAYVTSALSNVNVSASNITSGILPVARGGSGVTSNTGTGALVLNEGPFFKSLTSTNNVPLVLNPTDPVADQSTAVEFHIGGAGSNIPGYIASSVPGRGGNRFLPQALSASNMRPLYVSASTLGLNGTPGGGNVGVGTNAPTEKLHVAGGTLLANGVPGASLADAQTLSNYQIIVQNTATAGDACGVAFVSGLGVATATQTPGASIVYERTGAANFSGNLHFKTQAGAAGNPLTKRLTIFANGNVGIGESNPAYALDVNGAIAASMSNNNAVPGLFLNSFATNSTFLTVGNSLSNNQTGNLNFRRVNAAGTSNYLGLGFFGNDDILAVHTNTNVGIGITLPTQKLHVIGNILATGTITPSSDDRVKTDEAFIQDASLSLAKLRPQTYLKHASLDYASDSNVDASSPPFLESGLIAQEIFYAAPELRHLVVVPPGADSNALYHPDSNIAISGDPAVDPDYSAWGSNVAAVNYIGLIPYIVKALQEKDAEIAQLSARISALEP